MPLPAVDAVTAGFWAGCAARELRIQRCTSCGAYRQPPAVVCRTCQSFDSTWDESAGTGRVFSYTVVHHSVHPATDGSLPYNVAVIELDDCGHVFVTSNVVGCANDELRIGMPVRVVWDTVDDSFSLYRFAPVEDDNQGELA